MSNPNQLWPAERVTRWRELFDQGLSHSQIGTALGIGRNASIGKAHRLGLRRPPVSPPKSRQAAGSRPWDILGIARRTWQYRKQMGHPLDAPKQPRISNLKAGQQPRPPRKFECDDQLVLEEIPLGQRCSFLELSNERCRWPNGEPGHSDFFFCGGKPVDGLPYCGYHCRVAYNVRPSKK